MTQPRLPAPSPVVRPVKFDFEQRQRMNRRLDEVVDFDEAYVAGYADARADFFQVIQSMLPATDVSAIKDRLEGAR